MPTWILPTAVAVLAAALIASSTVAVVQYRAAADARQDLDERAEEVASLREEVEELRADLEDGEAEPGDDLQELLAGLLGGGTDLQDLLDGDTAELLDELLGGGADGLLDGLPDDDTDDDTDDDASGSAFDPTAAHGAECLTAQAGSGGLGSLFGGGGADEDVDGLDELVTTVSDQVAQERGLDWDQDAEVAFLDGDETRERLGRLFEVEEDERADLDARGDLLASLGAIPDDLDLAEVQGELLGDAVAGFYVPETTETVVRVPEDGLPGPVDRITLAHELQHALADQVLGLPERDEPPLAEDTDAGLAALALIEGDASLLMNLWALEHLSPMELLAAANDPEALGSIEAFDDVPDVLVRELVFPYTVGLDHVCDLYLDGGWDAVDEAYADPPTTSAEVMFGTPTDPVDVATSSAPSPDHELTYASSFGAAELLWQLEAPGGDPGAALPDARERAESWAGGVAEVWRDGDDVAVSISLAFDGSSDEPGCATMGSWADAAFPDATSSGADGGVRFDAGDRVVAVDCTGDDGDTDRVVVTVAGSDDPIDAMRP